MQSTFQSLLLACLTLGWIGLPHTTQATEPARTWQALPARPPKLPAAQQRLLRRLESSLERRQWDDAFDSAAHLLAAAGMFAVPSGDSHYVSLPTRCHQLLARLPPTQLQRYRELIDAPAQTWYERGIASRNSYWLQKVLDQAYCSSWGDDALWALGEMCLERGAPYQARSYWQQLVPPPSDQPRQRTYPDPSYAPAAVRARLVLAAIRAADPHRTAQELQQLQTEHPAAEGRIAGRTVNFVRFLRELQQTMGNRQPGESPYPWATFGGQPARHNACASRISDYRPHFSSALATAHACWPIVLDKLLVLHDATGIRALELATGQPAFTATHAVLANEKLPTETARGTLTASLGEVLGADAVPLGLRQRPNQTQSALWSVDMAREGALVRYAASQETSIAFAGAPLVDQGRLLVAVRSNNRSARSGIACYARDTHNKIKWQHWLCQANTPATGKGPDVATTLLTLDEGMVYLVSNLGAVAALRGEDGALQWLRTYPRTPGGTGADHSDLPLAPQSYYRGPNPGICYQGRLFAVPTDSDQLWAYETASGRLAWSHPLTTEHALLCGAQDGKLVLADGGIQVLETHSGELLWANHQLRIEGRGVLAGSQLLWPSGGKIHRLDLQTGQVAAPPIPLAATGPAHLTVTSQYLIATQPRRLTVWRAAAN